MSLLNDETIDKRLEEINEAWSVVGGASLVRVFETKDFSEGVDLIRKIERMANELNHHPDVDLTYGKVVVTVTTHSESGLTNKDFEFAAKVDSIE